jgi:predicted PurR-regulated permease PerM
MMQESKRLERIISGAALALLVIGCLVVLWPFISALLWAVVLSFASWPIYRRMLAFTAGRRTLAATLMTVLFTLILLLPFVVIGFTLADNVQDLTIAVRGWVEAPPEAPAWLYKLPLGSAVAGYWSTIAGDSQSFLRALGKFIEPASVLLLTGGLTVGRGLGELAISIFVAFFLYRDGVGIAHRAVRIARRIAGDRGEYLLRLAGTTVRSVVYGILGTALVQALVAGMGYTIARVPGVALLSLMTFFLAVTPIGPPLIYVPVALWLLAKGHTGYAIFMIAWGLMVSSVDNVVKPWLISQGSDMPFLLIFFGVIGGLFGFGFIGIFLGPTLLAVGYRLLQEWTGGPSDQLTAENGSGPIPPGFEVKI